MKGENANMGFIQAIEGSCRNELAVNLAQAKEMQGILVTKEGASSSLKKVFDSHWPTRPSFRPDVDTFWANMKSSKPGQKPMILIC